MTQYRWCLAERGMGRNDAILSIRVSPESTSEQIRPIYTSPGTVQNFIKVGKKKKVQYLTLKREAMDAGQWDIVGVFFILLSPTI